MEDENFLLDVLLSFVYPIIDSYREILKFIISLAEEDIFEIKSKEYELKILKRLQKEYKGSQINSAESCAVNYLRNLTKILEVN